MHFNSYILIIWSFEKGAMCGVGLVWKEKFVQIHFFNN